MNCPFLCYIIIYIAQADFLEKPFQGEIMRYVFYTYWEI